MQGKLGSSFCSSKLFPTGLHLCDSPTNPAKCKGAGGCAMLWDLHHLESQEVSEKKGPEEPT